MRQFLAIEEPKEDVVIKAAESDLDGLNYLAGKGMDFVNKSAMNGTILAHTDGQVPNFMVTVPEVNEFYLGELFLLLRVRMWCQRIPAGCKSFQPARCREL